MTNEQWKTIPGFENYEVSDLGRVKNASKVLSISNDGYGYPLAHLYLAGRRHTLKVHRLVMLAFVGERKLDVNHINGIKTDNRLVNLEYATRSENIIHAYRTGLKRGSASKGTNHYRSKLSENEVLEIRESLVSSKLLAAKFKVSINTIYYVRSGKGWKHVHQKPRMDQ